MAQGPRMAKNLQAILKWSLAQQGDGTTETQVDPERQKWLKEVIQSILSQPSDTDVLRASITILKANSVSNFNEESLEMLKSALDQILYLVEDLDHASDLVKMDGVGVILEYLDHPNMMSTTCDVIATASQNHPICQAAFLYAMPCLFEKLSDSQLPPETRTKALYAISCLSREFEPGQRELYKNDRLLILLECLQLDFHRMVIKVLFLLGRIYSSGSAEGSLELHLPAITGKIINLMECTTNTDVLCHAVVLLLTLFKFPVENKSRIECYHSQLKELLVLKRKILADENFKDEVQAVDQLLQQIK